MMNEQLKLGENGRKESAQASTLYIGTYCRNILALLSAGVSHSQAC